MITTILFDLDGVLVDAREWHYIALNKALRDICGIEISRDDHLTRYDGLPTLKKLEMLRDEGKVADTQFRAIFKLKQHYTMLTIGDRCKPDPVKQDMLYRLSDYKKACITNSISQTAYEMLVRSGLNYYLDYVQGNEATRWPKPNPSPYLHAMGVLGVAPVECLIVEDSDTGWKAAMATGASVLRISTYESLDYNLLKFHIEGPI